MKKIIGKGFVITSSRNTSRISKYQRMSSYDFLKTSSLDASDDGRCWWIYQFLISGSVIPFHERKVSYGKKTIEENYSKKT